MNPLFRRVSAVIASSALVVSGATLLSSPAQAATPDPRPLSIGASWLAGQLSDGLLEGDGNAPLYGPSIDAALSLKAAGGHASDVAAIGSAIADNITKYAEYDYTFGGHFQGQSAGATAKALVLAQALATPTTSLGGIDLLTRLEGFVASSGSITGRLVGVSTKDGVNDPDGEYTNVVGQALGVSALNTAGSTKLADVVAFLIKQQCSAGYFRVGFNVDKTAIDQTCDGGIAEDSSGPDVDATAISLRMLAGLGSPTPETAAAITKATNWLAAKQRADGSFGSGDSTGKSNSNSTAAAGLALAAAGRASDAVRAAVWVRQHQVDEVSGCTSKLSGATGAIAYSDGSLAAGHANGIVSTTSQEWRVAAAQSIPVLQYVPAKSGTFKVDGPKGYAKAGSTVKYTVSGVAPGEKVCVSGVGAPRRVVAGQTGSAVVPVLLPAGTANRSIITRIQSGSSASTLTNVLGAKTLSVAAPAKAKRGKKVTVTVRGLKPAEHVQVSFKGAKVRAGIANPNGVFVAKFPVGRKLGKAAVRAYGQFGDIRKGGDVIKVVR